METFWSVVAGGAVSIITAYLTAQLNLRDRREQRADETKAAAEQRAAEEKIENDRRVA